MLALLPNLLHLRALGLREPSLGIQRPPHGIDEKLRPEMRGWHRSEFLPLTYSFNKH